MPETKSSKKKHLSLALRAVVASGAIYWAFHDIDWDRLSGTLAEMNLWFFAGSLAIFTIAQIIVGFRWWLLLRSQSIFIGFWSAVRLNFLGLFYNNCMPGSMGGDLIRAWYVTSHTDKKLEAALSVFVDRIIGLAGMTVIAVVSYLLFMRGRPIITSGNQAGLLDSVVRLKWVFFWLAIALGSIVFIMLLLKPTRAILTKIWVYIRVHGAEVIKKLTEAVVIYCRNPLTIFTAFVLTIFIQSMVIMAFWVLGVNLGIDISPRYYFVFFPITWVMGAVPVSVAGLGIIEGGLKVLFTQFAGVAKANVAALALCNRAVLVLSSLPGAVIHLVGAHLPKEISVDYEESIN